MSEPSKPSNLRIRLDTIAQLFKSLGRTGRWWLVPLFSVLSVLGLILAGMQAVEFIVPFIYVVF